MKLKNKQFAKRIAIIALANEMTLDPDETKPISIPYGKWPYGMKTVEMPDGSKKKLYITQAFTQKDAAKIAGDLARSIAEGSLGIPVYEGHPDVPDLAHKYPGKAAIGWVKEITVGADAATLRVEWLKFPGKGFGWFSPYWFGAPDISGESALMAIDQIKSIGLTNDPNIMEFRLANEAMDDEAWNNSGPAAHNEGNNMELEQIKKELGLPPEATLEQIIAEITKIKTATADSATQVEAANAETEEAKKEKEETKVKLENERTARVGLLIDNAIADGRISVAAKPAWVKRLKQDVVAGSLALANEKPLKTVAKTDGLDPARNAAKGGISPLQLANEKVAKGMTFDAAWNAVKHERPELFASK